MPKNHFKKWMEVPLDVRLAIERVILKKVKALFSSNSTEEEDYIYRNNFTTVDGSLVDGFFDKKNEEITYFARKLRPNGIYQAGIFRNGIFIHGL